MAVIVSLQLCVLLMQNAAEGRKQITDADLSTCRQKWRVMILKFLMAAVILHICLPGGSYPGQSHFYQRQRTLHTRLPY